MNSLANWSNSMEIEFDANPIETQQNSQVENRGTSTISGLNLENLAQGLCYIFAQWVASKSVLPNGNKVSLVRAWLDH